MRRVNVRKGKVPTSREQWNENIVVIYVKRTNSEKEN
jgi:hypothetical protein